MLALAGFIWAEIKEMWDGGFTEYIHDWWNLMDFAMNSLYLATISLKMVAYFKVDTSILMQATLLQKLLQKTTCKSFQLVVGTRTVSIYLSYLLSPSVQRLSSSCGVGDVAPYAHRWGSIRHRQHLELSASHLSVHRQLSLGPTADLSRPHAAGHPQVPFHLLSGAAGLR